MPALPKARLRPAVPRLWASLDAWVLNQKQDAGLKPGATKSESGWREALRLRSGQAGATRNDSGLRDVLRLRSHPRPGAVKTAVLARRSGGD
jgi:hypothetical protein